MSAKKRKRYLGDVSRTCSLKETFSKKKFQKNFSFRLGVSLPFFSRYRVIVMMRLDESILYETIISSFQKALEIVGEKLKRRFFFE